MPWLNTIYFQRVFSYQMSCHSINHLLFITCLSRVPMHFHDVVRSKPSEIAYFLFFLDRLLRESELVLCYFMMMPKTRCKRTIVTILIKYNKPLGLDSVVCVTNALVHYCNELNRWNTFRVNICVVLLLWLFSMFV